MNNEHIALTPEFNDKYRALLDGFPDDFTSDEVIAKLASVTDSLINAGFNLTSVKGEDAILEKHIIDSLHAAKCIRELSAAIQAPPRPQDKNNEMNQEYEFHLSK